MLVPAAHSPALGSGPLDFVQSSRTSAAVRAIEALRAHSPAAAADAHAALARVLECVEAALDAHKMAAFKSALHEPARLWYHLAGNHHHRDHVNVHGLNGYLCLVRGALGCQMPLLPMEADGDVHKGCGNHWMGLHDAAWAKFSAEDNFGKDMEAILRQGTKGLLRSSTGASGGSGANDGFALPNGAALEERAKRGDTALLPYVSRFGYFFSSARLTRRLFESLNAEADPSLAGYARACSVLWPLFARGAEASEPPSRPFEAGTTSPDGSSSELEVDDEQAEPTSLVEYVYDEYFVELDVHRAEEWFQWLGVFKKRVTA